MIINDRRSRLLLPAGLPIVALLFIVGATLGAAVELDDADWVAPAFALADSKGRAFSSDDLKGHIWVAHFFYTTCTGGCTKTAPTMRELQALVRGKPGIKLVSFSLNEDSPEDLDRYARDLGADPEQWFFLTGDRTKIAELSQDGFKSTALYVPGAKPGEEIQHAFNLMIIDRQGRVRGYVDGREEGAAEAIYQRMRALNPAKYLFPAVNAVLNFQCAVLLLLGYAAIRQRRETLHKVAMISALVVSIVFLTSYLYFHIVIQEGQPTRFRGEGWVRALYFAILLSHTILAAVVAPLAVYITYEGFRDRRPRHVRVARWVLPVWLYVSITGVVVYWMLYQLYPPL